MVVVVIIGILVAIAIPLYAGVMKRAANNSHNANVRTLKGAGSIWISEHGLPTANIVFPTAETTQAALTPSRSFNQYLEGLLTDIKVPANSDATPSTLAGTDYSVTITTTGDVTVDPTYQ